MNAEFLNDNRGRYGLTYRCAKCKGNRDNTAGFRWARYLGRKVKICLPCAEAMRKARS